MITVYKATTSANKAYIGIATNLKKRISNHYSAARRKRGDTKFYRALRKYGDAIQWEVLETVDTWEQACEREIFYITKFDTYKNGYNSTVGGEGSLGAECSEAKREAISKKLTGKKASAAAIAARRRRAEVSEFLRWADRYTKKLLRPKIYVYRAVRVSGRYNCSGVKYEKGALVGVWENATQCAEDLVLPGTRNIFSVLNNKKNIYSSLIFVYEVENVFA